MRGFSAVGFSELGIDGCKADGVAGVDAGESSGDALDLLIGFIGGVTADKLVLLELDDDIGPGVD